MANSTTPQPSLLQRAALQTQANRYAFLRKSADASLVKTIVSK